MDKRHIMFDGNSVLFSPFSDKDEQCIEKIFKDNQMENLFLTDFQALVIQHYPLYRAR